MKTNVFAHKCHSNIVMLKWDTELFGKLLSPLQTSLTILSFIVCLAWIIHFLKWHTVLSTLNHPFFESGIQCTQWQFSNCGLLLESYSAIGMYLLVSFPSAFSSFGKPAQLWCNDLFEVSGVHSFSLCTCVSPSVFTTQCYNVVKMLLSLYHL